MTSQSITDYDHRHRNNKNDVRIDEAATCVSFVVL